MGVLPLQFPEGETIESLGLTGAEILTITGIDNGEAKSVTVEVSREEGDPFSFEAKARLDTPNEVAYFQHGGILQRVLRQLR
jgi:aconitate hydratase